MVDGVGASLGTSDGPTWSSALQTRLLIVLPLYIANDFEIMDTYVAWKLSLLYTGDSKGTGSVHVQVIEEGMQANSELQICIVATPTKVSIGSTNGIPFVQVKVPLQVTWVHTITSKLIVVFWTAIYQFGQNDSDLTHTISMVTAPSGWEQQGGLPTSRCVPSGVGSAFTPESWSFLPWSTITSNVQ
jgi:hypothetical protein